MTDCMFIFEIILIMLYGPPSVAGDSILPVAGRYNIELYHSKHLLRAENAFKYGARSSAHRNHTRPYETTRLWTQKIPNPGCH
jgi:hypothetical protein